MSKKTPEQQFAVTKKGMLDGKISIAGRKLPPPAKRIVLDLGSQKILSAKIMRLTKKGPLELTVERINYLPTRGETRLHTKETLYPGDYELTIEVK